MTIDLLTHKRLLVVGGKGGVGRSTVAAAVALAAARAGRHTLVVELAGRSDVARLLGGEMRPGLVEVELSSRLHHVTIDREAALRDYLGHEVPGRLPVGLLLRSRIFSAFVDAAPGMGELLAIGKVAELVDRRRRSRRGRPYDLVVLDGPASGQLLALLGAPGTFRGIARVGPVASQANDIERLLTDVRRTGVIVVSTPEQMAVSEVLALRNELDTQGVALDAVVLNKTVSSPFTSPEHRLIREAGDDPALRSALWFSERARVQSQQAGRLRRRLAGTPRTSLPLLFGGVDRAAIEQLATRLSRAF